MPYRGFAHYLQNPDEAQDFMASQAVAPVTREELTPPTLPEQSTEQFDKYAALLGTLPEREPRSMLARLAAGLIGGAVGLGNPGAGIATAKQLIDQPYNERLEDWKRQSAGQKELVDVESGRNQINLGNYDRAERRYRADRDDKRLEESQRKDAEYKDWLKQKELDNDAESKRRWEEEQKFRRDEKSRDQSNKDRDYGLDIAKFGAGLVDKNLSKGRTGSTLTNSKAVRESKSAKQRSGELLNKILGIKVGKDRSGNKSPDLAKMSDEQITAFENIRDEIASKYEADPNYQLSPEEAKEIKRKFNAGYQDRPFWFDKGLKVNEQ